MEKLLCGIDLGGTKLSAALIKPDGTIFDEIRTLDHKDKDADSIVKMMAEFVYSLLQRNQLGEEQLTGVGVGFPGHIRCWDGICIVTSNLAAGFKNYPLRQVLQGYFSKAEVSVDGQRLVRTDGHTVCEILDAVLSVFPLDSYSEVQANVMRVTPGDSYIPVIWEDFKKIVQKHEPVNNKFGDIERFEFYARAKKAYVVVQTSDMALYANILLTKGVI